MCLDSGRLEIGPLSEVAEVVALVGVEYESCCGLVVTDEWLDEVGIRKELAWHGGSKCTRKIFQGGVEHLAKHPSPSQRAKQVGERVDGTYRRYPYLLLCHVVSLLPERVVVGDLSASP
jgi:hypothetical protein